MGGLSEHWLELYRAQRHELLNHLQVISGWLQLGHPDRAMDYIGQVTRMLEQEAPLLRQAPAVAACLLEAAHAAARHAVPVYWDIPAPLPATLPVAELLPALHEIFALYAGMGPLWVSISAAPCRLTVTLPPGRRRPRALPAPLVAAIQHSRRAGVEVVLRDGIMVAGDGEER